MNQEHSGSTETSAAPEMDDESIAQSPEVAAEELAAEEQAAELSAQIQQLQEEVLRARAELDNQRKRLQRDVEAAHKYGTERLINELLPVKDSLDLGLDAAQSASDVAAIREGMALTAKMFGDVLQRLNIEEMDPIGQRFDPEHHQAMTMEEAKDVAPGTVVRVMQKGYLLHQRLLRPALVVVAKAADGEA